MTPPPAPAPPPAALAGLGARLRAAGLTPRALAAWAGTDHVAALPARLPALATATPVPAAAALCVFVAGAEVEPARLRLPPDVVDALLAAGLLERAGARVRAPVAVVPIGAGLVICDRPDAPDAPERVCWPDDSSAHLARALSPGRRARWLDLGCGSAVAPLARPELAAAITGVDLNPRAVAHAALGAALSGVAHLTARAGDVAAAAGAGPAALVTCNAPIPDAPDAAMWRRAGDGFFARLWPSARAALAPGGDVVVHAALAAIPDDLPGERVVCAYTPPGAPAFGVLWWRPDAPARRATGRRALTPARPHLEARDRDDALAGALPA